MDIKDIESFEIVYETRSIHKAANRLFITPQGLGRIIRSLEQELDTQLFERTRQGVIPTEAGDVLHRYGAVLAADMNHLREEMKALRSEGQMLRVGFANGVLRAIPLSLILDFAKLHPEIHVEWSEYSNREVRRKILEGELEYGLIVGDSRQAGLAQWKLRSIPQVLLVYPGHPLYEAQSVALERLEGEPLVTMNEEFRMYHDLIRACKIKGFEPNIIARTTDGGTVAQLCSQGAGLAILPEFGGGYPSGLHAIPFTEPAYWDVYAVCYEERRKYKAILTFEEYLKNVR